MIDIRKTSSPAVEQESKLPVILLAALCFVVWDSGYYKKWFPSQDREEQAIEVSSALLIKSPDMTVDQQYTASSPVLDEIADQRGIQFRVIDDAPGEISGAPEWLQKLFLKYESESPCIAVMSKSGKAKFYDAPSSVAEFRERINAR